MKNFLNVFKKISIFDISFLSLYFFVGLILLKYYQYQINDDGISYITIAQKYMHGDFSNAVNGYWGPLFSWFLMPFMLLGLSPLLSAKILSLIVGGFVIVGVIILSDYLELSLKAKIITYPLLIILAISYAYSIISPDFLSACLLIYYLIALLDKKYSQKRYKGFIIGILGALAYLSKSFSLPFFLVHFTICSILFFISAEPKKRKIMVTNFITGLLVFSIISGIWICLISNKYGYLTFGTSNKYNFSLVGPDSKGHPVITDGLIKPPNSTAISAWEDPTYLKIVPWSPFQSLSSLKWDLMISFKNIAAILCIYPILLIILFSYLCLISKVNSKYWLYENIKITVLLLAIVIYCFGYILIFIEYRYLFFVSFLTIPISVYVLFDKLIFNIKMPKKLIYNLILFLLIGFFVFLVSLYPISRLANSASESKNIYNISQDLEKNYHIKGNIASNDNWFKTHQISFLLNCKYFGVTKENASLQEIKQELKKYDIDYYLFWDKSQEVHVLTKQIDF